jgi:hypothetical protein
MASNRAGAALFNLTLISTRPELEPKATKVR